MFSQPTSEQVPPFWPHGESAHVSCIQDEDGWHCVVVTAVVVTGVLKVVPLSGNMVLQVSPVIIYQNRDYFRIGLGTCIVILSLLVRVLFILDYVITCVVFSTST